MGDVTAVVLSVGEPTLRRALESLKRQTLVPAKTVLVENITPFHTAFNAAVQRVQTDYFVQVDADMVLDSKCIEELYACMMGQVGLVVGHLRDSLVGKIVGIKLFKTNCVSSLTAPDSVSPETDLSKRILEAGWTITYALKHSREVADWHVFGDHSPDYTFQYTYSKFLREGAKARYRRASEALIRLFRQLGCSRHPSAIVAVVALSHGIFRRTERDQHLPPTVDKDSRFLEAFLCGDADATTRTRIDPGDLANGDTEERFRRACVVGTRLRMSSAQAEFRRLVQKLQEDDSMGSWATLVGICHGLFSNQDTDAGIENDLLFFRELLSADIDGS